MTVFILICIQLLFVPAVSPAVIGIIRKVKALLQNRRGAGIVQPYRDLWKLFHKDEVISKDTSWIFRCAPTIIFGVTLVIAAGIPVLSRQSTFAPVGDFLVFVYLMALATFFLALAGMDAASSFGGFGSSREMTFAALIEGGLVFCLLTVALVTGSGNIAGMAEAIGSVTPMQIIPIIVAWIGFLIALVAENARVPVDNPATHLELTMIHEAMILEYSGKRLALMEWASFNKLLIFIVVAVQLFLPWGIPVSTAPAVIAVAFAILIAKSLCIAIGIGVLESSIAKLRIFAVPSLLFTSFMLGVIAVVISIF